MNREGRVIDCRQAGRETGPAGVVTILVPPAVFEKMQVVFDPPVLTDMLQKILGSDPLRVQTAYVVAGIVQDDFTISSAQLAINAQGDLAARQVECLANVLRIV